MNKTYFIGDIHGNFQPLIFYMIHQKQPHDCYVFACGDIGMGFHKFNYYVDEFNRMNKKLSQHNIQLCLIRGNHDNPIFFTSETPLDVYYSNIHFIEDYEILTINNHNILCIGGATSVDRIYRTENENWWSKESVQEYDRNIVNENNSMLLDSVDIVVSHSAPMFVSPKYERISWMSDDDDIRAKNDRLILSNVYFDICKNLKYWFHGHFHMHYETYVPNDGFTDHEKALLTNGSMIMENEYDHGCKFVCLDMLEGMSGKIDLYGI